MKIYTLWIKTIDSDDAFLLDTESIYKTKKNAFKRAKTLADRLVYGRDEAILVRKVNIVNDMCDENCIEWTFPAIP